MSRKESLQKALLGKKVLIIFGLLAFFIGTIGLTETQAQYKFPSMIYWGSGDVGTQAYTADAIVAEKIAPALGSNNQVNSR